jgi:2-polyprenyl-3-methyl-5-hydroxy-6-metoxy-1,4-benzoquinol methylase
MAMISMHCPVCNGSSFVLGWEVFDDRYGEPNRYHLCHCSICGHIATAPRLSEADLPVLYGTFYPRKKISAEEVAREASDVKGRFATIRRWWNGTDNQGQYGVRPGEVMLDVGCGSGVSLLEARAFGAQAFGIEADPNVKPIAEALDLTIHFGTLEDQPFSGQAFDLIILNQVIEHLPDPDKALQILRQRLKPHGRIVLVFPNYASLWRRIWTDRWIHWHIPYHLHHFTLKSFVQMAERGGFMVRHHRTITPNLWTLLQLRALRHKPHLGVPSSLWAAPDQSEPSAPSRRKNALFRSIASLALRSLFAIVNRSVDALGHGDSLLVELRSRGE